MDRKRTRTRFAPSPTGFLHIGGVRTALFNWLFARQHGGQFILRIDDTDTKRNVEAALAPILDGFRWLGLDWDEGPECGGAHGPYYQSEKLQRYQSAVSRLVEAGCAYHDYSTAEEYGAERNAADAEKRPFHYSRHWAAPSEAERRAFEGEGRKSVVRLRMPREGYCEFVDLVRGDMRVAWAQEPDHVIQRADGTCLYHLANVVDDYDMGISHVIRASEHLSNTPRQIFIAAGLGYALPEYAHLPFVAEPGSKTKLSKRKLDKYLRNVEFAKLHEHGQRIAEGMGLGVAADTFNPVIVDFYEAVGFRPEALVNYLVLLGWSLDDHTEFIDRETMIAEFGFERINKAPASFDPQKLIAFQEHYMSQLPLDARVALARPYVEAAGWSGAGVDLTQLVAGIGARLKVAGDVLGYPEFFIADDALQYEEKPFRKRLRKPPGVAALVGEYRESLNALARFDAEALEVHTQEFVARRELRMGDIVHAIRVAVTGRGVGFGLFETLHVLGRERVQRRLELALDKLRQPGDEGGET